MSQANLQSITKTLRSELGLTISIGDLYNIEGKLGRVLAIGADIYCFEIDGITYRDREPWENVDMEWYETDVDLILLTEDETDQIRKQFERDSEIGKSDLNREEANRKLKIELMDNSFKDFLNERSVDLVWSGYDLPKECYLPNSPLKLHPELYTDEYVGNGLGHWCKSVDLENLFQFIRHNRVSTTEELHYWLNPDNICAGRQYYVWLRIRKYETWRHPKPSEMRVTTGKPMFKNSKAFCTGYKGSGQASTTWNQTVNWSLEHDQWQFENGLPVPIEYSIQPHFEAIDSPQKIYGQN